MCVFVNYFRCHHQMTLKRANYKCDNFKIPPNKFTISYFQYSIEFVTFMINFRPRQVKYEASLFVFIDFE